MGSGQTCFGNLSPTQTCSATQLRASQPVLMSTAKAGRRLHNLFQDRPVLTLERSVGKVAGADTDLWQSGLFKAGITPDLPVVSSWKEVAVRLLGRPVAAPQVVHAEQLSAEPTASESSQQWHVQTVAAQTHSYAHMRQKIMEACSSQSGAQQPADALLCLSGSHPLRKVPFADRWMTNSMQTLRLAEALRLEGQIPAHTSLWAVENPLSNPAARLQQKVDAGAEVIITQPPLLWHRFEKWIDSVQRQRLLGDSKLLVGCPMISSAGNMKFWLYLGQALHMPEAAAAIEPFATAAAKGKECLHEHCVQYNADLVQRVLAIPEVAGLHVMPLTKQSRKQTLPLMQSLILKG